MNNYARIKGFSIVEIMIATTIGLILLAAITALMVNSSTSFQTTNSISRLQENARFAIEFIGRDLRNAGNFGCSADVETVSSTLKDSTNISSKPLAIEGLEQGKTIFYPSDAALLAGKKVDPESDAIAIRYMDGTNPVSITQQMPNESAALFVNPGHDLQEGDIIMVSDCDSADIMQLTNIQAGTGGNSGKDGLVHNAATGDLNNTQKLSKSYGPGANVFRFRNYAYYIAEGKSGRRALWRGNQELVEGIENMQIRYGVDRSGSRMPTIFLKADEITNDAEWRNIVAVRIGLLVTAIADTATGEIGTDVDNNKYDLNGTKDTSDDYDPFAVPVASGFPAKPKKVVRKEFVTTIELRNIR